MGFRIEYDEIYNRTSMSRADMPVKLPAAFTNDPAYNAANRLTGFNSADIDHDENGNMTGWGSTTYTWDEFNRLVAINGTSLDASYKYDALGRRIEKTINNTTTKYLYDGADIVLEMDESNVATAYYIRTLNIDEPLARIELDSGGNVTGIRFYLADALGSIIALTDENGDIKTRYNYTPFGEVEVIGEQSSNPFQFAGRENDEGTGLLFERNRYYSFELGRYISEDPIRFAGGDINFYVRVGNNPVNFVDPLGLKINMTTVVIGSITKIIPIIPSPVGDVLMQGGLQGLSPSDSICSAAEGVKHGVESGYYTCLRKCLLKPFLIEGGFNLGELGLAHYGFNIAAETAGVGALLLFDAEIGLCTWECSHKL